MEMSAEFEEMPFETHNRAQNYFQLLEIVNETSSRPPTPGLRSVSSASGSSNANSQSTRDEGGGGDRTFAAEAMAEGYFKAFFREEHKLGMGANGSVFLCQVRIISPTRSEWAGSAAIHESVQDGSSARFW